MSTEASPVKGWLKKHRKKLSTGGGALLLIVGMGMLFWSNEKGAVEGDAEAKALANLARMEGKAQGKSAEPSASPFMESYKAKQEQNVRYMVIALVIGGAAFLAYGLLKKEEAS